MRGYFSLGWTGLVSMEQALSTCSVTLPLGQMVNTSVQLRFSPRPQIASTAVHSRKNYFKLYFYRLIQTLSPLRKTPQTSSLTVIQETSCPTPQSCKIMQKSQKSTNGVFLEQSSSQRYWYSSFWWVVYCGRDSWVLRPDKYIDT